MEAGWHAAVVARAAARGNGGSAAHRASGDYTFAVRNKPLEVQKGLFDEGPPSFDPTFAGLERVQLDPASWVDVLPGWVRGADNLFDALVETRPWKQRLRLIHGKRMQEPRLTAPWSLEAGGPLEPAIIDELRLSLSRRYGVLFDSVGFNLYRDGKDSVAWHGDHIRKEIAEPVIALVSLGAPRRLLLRPKGGGPSRAWPLGRGDLFVTGGRTQRAWEHSVPKVAQAAPRISLAFRYGLESKAYEGPEAVPQEADD